MNEQEKSIQEARIEKYTTIQGTLCELRKVRDSLDNKAFSGDWTEARQITSATLSFSLPNGRGGQTIPVLKLEDLNISAWDFSQWLRGRVNEKIDLLTKEAAEI